VGVVASSLDAVASVSSDSRGGCTDECASVGVALVGDTGRGGRSFSSRRGALRSEEEGGMCARGGVVGPVPVETCRGCSMVPPCVLSASLTSTCGESLTGLVVGKIDRGSGAVDLGSGAGAGRLLVA